MTREEMIQQLSEGVCLINGRMFTLNPDYFGLTDIKPSAAYRTINETVSNDQLIAVDPFNVDLVVIPISEISSFQKL